MSSHPDYDAQRWEFVADNKAFEIHTDVNEFAIGKALMQNG